MKRTLAVGVLGAALAAAAFPAMAQPRPDRGPDRIQTRLFDQADTNKDGRVTEAELVEFLSVRFAEADADKDGAITPEELGRFVRAQFEANRPPPAAGRELSPRALRAMEERQATVFRIVDADRDGRITLEEARVVVLAVFRAADANGDGAIERDEMRGGHHRRGASRPATPPAPPAAPAP